MAIATYNDLANLIEAWWPEDAVTSGSDVTSLPGSFNSRTLTTPATDPQIVAAGLPGGNESISFSGSGPYLALISSNLVTGSAMTFMAMVKYVTFVGNNYERMFSFNQTGSADWNTVTGTVFGPTNGFLDWPDGFRNSSRLPRSAVHVGADTWHLFMAIYDGTDITFYTAVSGATGWTTRDTGGNTGTFDIDEFYIGADSAGTQRQAMSIGDVVWYSDAKGSTDRQDLFDLAYARNFTGIAAATYVRPTLAVRPSQAVHRSRNW